jgi:hypothetical protein
LCLHRKLAAVHSAPQEPGGDTECRQESEKRAYASASASPSDESIGAQASQNGTKTSAQEALHLSGTGESPAQLSSEQQALSTASRCCMSCLMPQPCAETARGDLTVSTATMRRVTDRRI